MHLHSRSLLFGILVVASLLMPRVTRADGGLPPPMPDAALHLADRPDSAIASDPVTVAVETAKRVEAIQAAERAGDATALRLAIAGLLAFLLRFVVEGVKKLANLSEEAKRVIPWTVLGIGVVIGVVDRIALGDAWVHAIIVGAAAPGSVLVHELISSIKSKVPVAPVALFLCAFGMTGCEFRLEWIGVGTIALGLGIVLVVTCIAGRPKNLLALAVLLGAGAAYADVVKRPGAPVAPAWGMLVVPSLMVGLVVIGAGVLRFLLRAAARRRRAFCGPLALLLLAISSPALASPASPSAGESIAIAGGCMAILFVVVGSVVAGCQLTMRRQRRRGGRLVGALLLLAAPAYADPPAAVESPATPAPVAQPALAPAAPAVAVPVMAQQPQPPAPVAPAGHVDVPPPLADVPPPVALDPRRAIASGVNSPVTTDCTKCLGGAISTWNSPNGKLAVVGIVLGSLLQVGLQVGVPVGLHALDGQSAGMSAGALRAW